MAIDIAGIIAAIPAAFQIVTSIKDLLNSAKDDLEESDSDWCTYINTLHGFKVSWPSQRWNLHEGGNVSPNLYMPALLSSIMSFPVTMPNPYAPGQFWTVVPTVTIYVDLQGSISIGNYVQASLENKRKFYKPSGGHFVEERTARKVLNDSATFAGSTLFVAIEDAQSTTLWDMTRVSRSGNRMISVIGNIVEGSQNFNIILDDLIKIIRTVSLLRK